MRKEERNSRRKVGRGGKRKWEREESRRNRKEVRGGRKGRKEAMR